MLAAILEVLMGNMFGPIIFISGFIQGIGSEIAFAAGKYKNYSYRTTITASVLCTVFTFIWTGVRQNYLTFEPGNPGGNLYDPAGKFHPVLRYRKQAPR